MNQCELCEQEEATIKIEDGIAYYYCNHCGSEYADASLVRSNNKPKTTKECPACGCEVMVSYHSTNEKQCADCLLIIPWSLDKGQKAVFNDRKSD